ncbi:hypothetical protein QL285_091458 [Trifolium repens]|nr:hypothetical protein QL285_091458 [Trifolium repens]
MLSLPRTLSRKLSSKRTTKTTTQRCKGEREIEISTVKIKDIIRWKSFRDLQPSVPLPPLDFNCYVTESSTVTTAATTCSSSDGGSSWSDGDFFSDLWEAQNDGVGESKKSSFSSFFVGKDSVAPSFVGTKEDLTCQDEQHSPVSVLHVAENEFSIFDQSFANIERRKQKFKQTADKFESHVKFDFASLDGCLSLDENSYYDEEYKDDNKEEVDQKVEELDWVEEKANQLLHCVKATCSSVEKCDDNFGIVLLDFFKEELSGNRNQKRNSEEFEIMKIAEDWINESFENAYDIVHVNKDAYIKEMDRRDGWNRLEEEQEEMVFEIEAAILRSLVDEIFNIDG